MTTDNPILQEFFPPKSLRSRLEDCASLRGWAYGRMGRYALELFVAEEEAREAFYGRPNGAAMMTAAGCRAEAVKATQQADSLEAMAQHAGKGLQNAYRALADKLRDVAQQWEMTAGRIEA